MCDSWWADTSAIRFRALAGSRQDLAGDFRPCCGDELVEGGFLEFTFGERLPARVRKRSGLTYWNEGDRAPTEASSCEACAPGTVLLRRFYKGVQLGGGGLVVVAQRGVRGVHQAPELVEIPVLERLGRLEDAGVLGDDVPGAF